MKQIGLKHLRTLHDLSDAELKGILDLAQKVKKNPARYRTKLSGKSVALLFEKTSTRTRTSFDVGIAQLGGHSITLDWKSTQLGKASLKDEIRCIARYVDIIAARVYAQSTIDEMAKFAKKPVINMLSDTYHPCQALGDLLTIIEHVKNPKKAKIVYIGGGNNVCNSLIIATMKMGWRLTVSTPKGYGPDAKVVRAAIKKGTLTIEHDPTKACDGADVVYTDTWVSMGQEKQRTARLAALKDYQVNKRLIGKALFMHCLPAFRGEEVTDGVMDGPRSIVFDQAENRLHAQKALLMKILSR